MNNNHTYNADVYIGDVDARVGVLQFLNDLGYEFSAGKSYKSFLSNEWQWSYDTISCNPIITIQDGYVGIGSCGRDKLLDDIMDYMKKSQERQESISSSGREFVCCGLNKELFKAVAMMRNDRDDNQYYVERGNPNREDNIKIIRQWKKYPEDCNIEWCLQYIKKATLEDLKEFL